MRRTVKGAVWFDVRSISASFYVSAAFICFARKRHPPCIDWAVCLVPVNPQITYCWVCTAARHARCPCSPREVE